MWGTYDEFIKDLILNFNNPVTRDEAHTKFSHIVQGKNEKAAAYVIRARKLNLEADFETSKVWEYLWQGLNEDIQEWMIRERIAKDQWDAPSNLQACYIRIHDAGRRVEEHADNKIMARQKRVTLDFLQSKGRGGNSGSGAGEGSGSKTSMLNNSNCKINFTK